MLKILCVLSFLISIPVLAQDKTYEEYKKNMDKFVGSVGGKLSIQDTGAIVLDNREGSTCLNCYSKTTLDKQPLLEEWSKKYIQEKLNENSKLKVLAQKNIHEDMNENSDPSLTGCSFTDHATKIECPHLGRTYVLSAGTLQDQRVIGKDVETLPTETKPRSNKVKGH